VDQKANIANWIIPNGKQLEWRSDGPCDRSKKVVIAMQHTSKNGKSKLVKTVHTPHHRHRWKPTWSSPSMLCLSRQRQTHLREIAPEITLDELRAITDADFDVDL